MRYCGRNNAAISLYFKVVFTFYLLPTPPYRSTQRCIVEQQMSDIDIRRQIWHLAAPIDWDGLLGESGGGGEVGAGQILKWENIIASFNYYLNADELALQFSRSGELSSGSVNS